MRHVTTGWELRYVGDRPRLVTAYIKTVKESDMTRTHTVIEENDVVRFIEAVERWPAGTEGSRVCTRTPT